MFSLSTKTMFLNFTSFILLIKYQVHVVVYVPKSLEHLITNVHLIKFPS